MAENCKLIECEQDMQNVVQALLGFKEQFRGIAGRESFGVVYFRAFFISRLSSVAPLLTSSLCFPGFSVVSPTAAGT